MKKTCLYLLALSFLISACGGGSGGKQQDTTANAQAPEIDPAMLPGYDKAKLSDTVSLEANDNMQFNKDLFKIKSGKKIKLILKNVGAQTGASMSHNVVILKKGIDIATFADSARLAKKTQFIPPSFTSAIIAHTNLVSAGKSAQIEFTIDKPGVYDFICSYEGHWGTMQGKIVAE